MYSKCFLDCDYQFFIDQNKADASSCIKHQVDELKDIHESYGGFPETYTMANTKIYQTWFDKTEIDFDSNSTRKSSSNTPTKHMHNDSLTYKEKSLGVT